MEEFGSELHRFHRPYENRLPGDDERPFETYRRGRRAIAGEIRRRHFAGDSAAVLENGDDDSDSDSSDDGDHELPEPEEPDEAVEAETVEQTADVLKSTARQTMSLVLIVLFIGTVKAYLKREKMTAKSFAVFTVMLWFTLAFTTMFGGSWAKDIAKGIGWGLGGGFVAVLTDIS